MSAPAPRRALANVPAPQVPRPGSAVQLDDVTKAYATGAGERLLAADGVSLDVSAGSSVALTGASGSGKSTLLQLMGAMDVPTSGTVRVDGTDLGSLSRSGLAAYRRQVGFVFQRFHLLPALTVEDNVIAPLLPVRVRFDRRARARELIAAVGLQGREGDLPSRLSGGQQQRVAIARALVNQPALLLADEPTGNLDSATGEDVLSLLLDLQRGTGMTMVVATHDVQVATRCDRLLRIRDGALVEDRDIEPAPSDLLDQVSRLQGR